ncbi:SDR family oxidoreductase [Nocardia flavorosea]|uniref:SDR family oxidoreductase n=1 Tax=Nocardia flavorosea TaxID=53429 RepID=A0A846YHP5_9NOCA|nr:SDR family oxidoreductase [Nocardia flavorosea]NKY58335.1 SDR family oxidoreductase [Nocardia flavorosea]
MDLSGQRVVVLGGSSGIGHAIAREARKSGAEVTIASRNELRLERAASDIPGSRFQVCDMRDERQVERLFEESDPIDHVVVTAAEVGVGPVSGLRKDDVQCNFDSRVWGSFFVAKHAASRLPEHGSITLMSGIAAWRGLPGEAVGAASVGAVEAFARALAVELAPRRVNTLCPGLVDTPLLDHVLGDEREAVVRHFTEKLPAGRIGTPDEIADAALFLMRNRYVTGTTLHIDGGHLLV